MVSSRRFLSTAKERRTDGNFETWSVLLRNSDFRWWSGNVWLMPQEHALENKPDIIDINMGCPAPKISSNGSGSALMKNLGFAEKLSRLWQPLPDIPVTVKSARVGWWQRKCRWSCKICESAGAAAITVHGRTRQQYYKPPADYDIIRAVRESVSVPVIANGDIDSAERAKEVMDITGCDLVMIGRQRSEIRGFSRRLTHTLKTRMLKFTLPTLKKGSGVMIEHIGKMVEYKVSIWQCFRQENL